eukprot:13645360-Alexandrium_andersonii.AAC.1
MLRRVAKGGARAVGRPGTAEECQHAAAAAKRRPDRARKPTKQGLGARKPATASPGRRGRLGIATQLAWPARAEA